MGHRSCAPRRTQTSRKLERRVVSFVLFDQPDTRLSLQPGRKCSLPSVSCVKAAGGRRRPEGSGRLSSSRPVGFCYATCRPPLSQAGAFALKEASGPRQRDPEHFIHLEARFSCSRMFLPKSLVRVKWGLNWFMTPMVPRGEKVLMEGVRLEDGHPCVLPRML